jgi:EAL domain-containing protein (putative c-di-GMP-specific phosphodiesterase class I)
MAEALSVSEKLRIAVSTRPLPVASKPINITASFGVSKVPPEVSSIEEILSLTRLPLQRSKSKGKNIVSIAQKNSIIKTSPTSKNIIGRLLQGDCFYAASQPIFHLTEERVVGHELLSRSTIENFEMPVQFLGLALENDILTHVDLQCFKNCIAGTALLKPKVRFHVNLFPSTMLSTPIESLLKLFPQGRKRWEFCVEISEQQFIGDPAYFKEYITALKEAGILIALDDIGFGRSSLESLVVLEPDLVKIDRSYVNGIAKDKGKRMSFQRMLEIFKSLETQQIAEGIETKEDLNILKEMGVAYGQGYLWGKPSRIQTPEQKEHEAVLKAADTKKWEQTPALLR